MLNKKINAIYLKIYTYLLLDKNTLHYCRKNSLIRNKRFSISSLFRLSVEIFCLFEFFFGNKNNICSLSRNLHIIWKSFSKRKSHGQPQFGALTVHLQLTWPIAVRYLLYLAWHNCFNFFQFSEKESIEPKYF